MDDDQYKKLLSGVAAFKPPSITPIAPRLPDSAINPAKWAYERLAKRIGEFETDLNDDEEIGARLVAAPGPDAFFHIEDVSYWGPDMIMFTGKNADGRKVELIQHHTQLSVLLTALPKQQDKPRRIGFHLNRDVEEK